MKLKDRIKTYNFWVSLSSAIFLLLKVLGTQFGFRVDESLFSDLITSLCGILVILGIIVPPSVKFQNNANILTSASNNLWSLQQAIAQHPPEAAEPIFHKPSCCIHQATSEHQAPEVPE